MAKNEIEILVTAEVEKAIKNIDKLGADIQKNTKKTQSALEKSSKAWRLFGSAIIGGVVVKGFSKLIKSASDAQETLGKFNVVFKDVRKEAELTAKNLAKNFGLSSDKARELLANTGDLLTGFGFTGKAALDLSKQVNELAVDLASFTNFSGGAEGASAALTKALLGERESVKSLGISILETDVKAKVLENTQKGLTFETERQAKAYATLQIAQEQSLNSLGDFQRTSGSLANQTRILKARFDDLIKSLGKNLIPIATKVVGIVIKLIDRFSKLPSSVQVVSVSIAALIPLVISLNAALGPLGIALAAIATVTASVALQVEGLNDEIEESITLRENLSNILDEEILKSGKLNDVNKVKIKRNKEIIAQKEEEIKKNQELFDKFQVGGKIVDALTRKVSTQNTVNEVNAKIRKEIIALEKENEALAKGNIVTKEKEILLNKKQTEELNKLLQATKVTEFESLQIKINSLREFQREFKLTKDQERAIVLATEEYKRQQLAITEKKQAENREKIIRGSQTIFSNALSVASSIVEIETNKLNSIDEEDKAARKKQAERVRKAAIAEKALAVTNTTIDTIVTAQRAAKALAGIPIVGPALAAAAAIAASAAGAARVATIISTPIPAFQDGGITEGGVALVGEQGPELAEFPAGTRIRDAQETQSILTNNNRFSVENITLPNVKNGEDFYRELQRIQRQYGAIEFGV